MSRCTRKYDHFEPFQDSEFGPLVPVIFRKCTPQDPVALSAALSHDLSWPNVNGLPHMTKAPVVSLPVSFGGNNKLLLCSLCFTRSSRLFGFEIANIEVPSSSMEER